MASLDEYPANLTCQPRLGGAAVSSMVNDVSCCPVPSLSSLAVAGGPNAGKRTTMLAAITHISEPVAPWTPNVPNTGY